MRARLGTFVRDESGETVIEYVMLGLFLTVMAFAIFTN